MAKHYLTDDNAAEFEAAGTLNEFRNEEGELEGIQMYLQDDRSFSDLLLDWSILASSGNAGMQDPQPFLASIGLANTLTTEQWWALISGEAAPGNALAQTMAKHLPPDLNVTPKRFLSEAAFMREKKRFHIIDPKITAAPSPEKTAAGVPSQPVAQPIARSQPILDDVSPDDSIENPFYRLLIRRLRALVEGRSEYAHLSPHEAGNALLATVARAVGVDPWALQGIMPIPHGLEPEDVTQRLSELLFGADTDSKEAHEFGNLAYECLALAKNRNRLDLSLAAKEGAAKPFGEVIALLRERCDLARMACAKQAGVTDTKLASWESGRIAPPTGTELDALLQALALPKGSKAAKAMHGFAGQGEHRFVRLHPEARKYWQQKATSKHFGDALTGLCHLIALSDSALAEQLNEENARSATPRSTPYTAREVWRWRYGGLVPEVGDITLLDATLKDSLPERSSALERAYTHVITCARTAQAARPAPDRGESEALTHARRHGTFGQLLQAYMKEKGLTQSKLAALVTGNEIDDNQNEISQWVIGALTPRMSNAIKLADILDLHGLSRDDFFRRREENYRCGWLQSLESAIHRRSFSDIFRAQCHLLHAPGASPWNAFDIAQKTGVGEKAIRDWQSGREFPSQERLTKCMAALALGDLETDNIMQAHHLSAARRQEQNDNQIHTFLAQSLKSADPQSYKDILRAYRLLKNWRIDAAWNNAGISKSALFRMENASGYPQRSVLIRYMNALEIPQEHQRLIIHKIDEFNIKPELKKHRIEKSLSETPLKFGEALRLYREISPRSDGGMGHTLIEVSELLKSATGTGMTPSHITLWEAEIDFPCNTPRFRNYMQALAIPADMQTRLIEAQHKVLAARYADYPKPFGDLLTRLRGEAMNRKTGTPFSRHALAKRLNISDDMVINWENGVSVPNDALLERTAAVLHLNDYEQALLKEAIICRAQQCTHARETEADESIAQALASDAPTAFALLLRAYREKAGLSHKKARAQSDIPADKISDFENGKPYFVRSKLCSYMDSLQMPPEHQLFVINGMEAVRANLPAKQQAIDALLAITPLPFGELLHAYREITPRSDGSYGYSADDAAAAMRTGGHTLSQSTISRWESGKDWPRDLTILNAYITLLQIPEPICQRLTERFQDRHANTEALHEQMPAADKDLIHDTAPPNDHQTDGRLPHHRASAPGTHITQPDHNDRIVDRLRSR